MNGRTKWITMLQMGIDMIVNATRLPLKQHMRSPITILENTLTPNRRLRGSEWKEKTSILTLPPLINS